jgi:hypothetical protein
MGKHTTDTPHDNRFVSCHSEVWGDIDYSSMLHGETEPVLTDDDLHDNLGLRDRRIEVIYSEIVARRKNNK